MGNSWGDIDLMGGPNFDRLYYKLKVLLLLLTDPTLVISIVITLIFQKDSKGCLLKLVVLVKLAFAMKKLKNILKNSCCNK